VKKQLKHAAESYISAIRSQQAQMTDELDELFKKDLQPAMVMRVVLQYVIFFKA